MRRILLIVCLSLAVVGLSPRRAQSYWPCCPTYCCAPCYPACCVYSYPVCYRPCPAYCCGWYGPVVYRAPVVIRAAAPVVRVPVAAMTVIAPPRTTVYVDGVRVPLQDGQLTFEVPDLNEGQRYLYRFRAETVRDGQQVVVNREVTFRAGDTIRVDFSRTAAADARR